MDLNLSTAKQSYWNGNGAYEDEYLNLYDVLVPDIGCAKTIAGEMIRAASRLYYEYFNNGNDNAMDIQYDEDYDEVIDVAISSFYNSFIEFLDRQYSSSIGLVDSSIVDAAKENLNVIRSIIAKGELDYTEENEMAYNNMIDYCMYFVLNVEALQTQSYNG